jgi:hypothetical protein
MAGDAAILKFDGTADQAAATLKGKLDAKIAEPGVLLQIAGARGLPPALTKPFTLTSSIDASAKSIELPDLALSLGDDKATGNIAVQLGSPVLVDASLAFGRLDLDKLLPEIQPALPAEAPSSVAAAPAASGTAPAPTTPPLPGRSGANNRRRLPAPGIAASPICRRSRSSTARRPSPIRRSSPISQTASWRSSSSPPICLAARTSASPARWRARTGCRSSSGRCRRNRQTSAS